VQRRSPLQAPLLILETAHTNNTTLISPNCSHPALGSQGCVTLVGIMPTGGRVVCVGRGRVTRLAGRLVSAGGPPLWANGGRWHATVCVAAAAVVVVVSQAASGMLLHKRSCRGRARCCLTLSLCRAGPSTMAESCRAACARCRGWEPCREDSSRGAGSEGSVGEHTLLLLPTLCCSFRYAGQGWPTLGNPAEWVGYPLGTDLVSPWK
jgi:hypothetical protein